MVNKISGEATLKVGDETYTLNLTLGAIAEIETETGLGSVNEVGERLQNPSAKYISVILTALLHGGGHRDVTLEDVLAMTLSANAAMEAIAEAMSAAGVLSGGDEDDKNPPEPRVQPRGEDGSKSAPE